VKPASFDPAADTELVLAVAWYEQRKSGRGEDLLREIKKAMGRITSQPRRFPRLLDLPKDLIVRRAWLLRFPYALIFEKLEDEVCVLAVAHSKRAPDYWHHRLQ